MFRSLWQNRSSRIFLLIFVFSVLIRVWSINNPILDQHAWRQSSSAIVARNYLSDMNPFHPRVDMINRGQYPSAFGFYEYYVALLAKVVGFSNQLGRSLSLFVFLVGLVFFYRLVTRFFGERTALWASAFYSFLPVSAYYSRSFQPDSGMVSLTVVFMYYFTRWVDEERRSDYVLSIVAAFFMFSFKIVSLYMLIPATAYLFMHKRWKALTDARYYVMVAVALALPVFYHLYVPIATGGFYKSAFFNQDKWGNAAIWLSFEYWFKTFLPFGNLWEYQFMHAGYILFVLGIFQKVRERRQWVFHVWLGAVFLFFIVAAYGMHHEYYSLPLMPVGCIFIGRFLDNFFSSHAWADRRRRFAYGLVSFMVLYTFVFSLCRLWDRCDIRSNMAYLPVSAVVRAATRPGDIVLYSTKGYEELQYLCARKGLHFRPPYGQKDGMALVGEYERMADRLNGRTDIHYKMLVMTDYDLARKEPELYRSLKTRYRLLYETDKAYVFQLDRPGSPDTDRKIRRGTDAPQI
jgi:4-amino-4-deoxy-L-arabinose transferase-like glycosyltransferase